MTSRKVLSLTTRAEVQLLQKALLPEEYRAITLPQLHSLATLINQVLDIRDLIDNNKHSSTHGQKITWLMANMYQICDEFVKPLTKRDMCSWVELVTNKDKQECVWFMSHAWLTPFNQTLEMLEWHTRVHQLGHTGYWFCTLANNQHDLSELAGGLSDTPFWKAIALKSCIGMVQLMDEACTPPRRIWCVLEIYIVVVVENKGFEVLAMIPKYTQTIGGCDVPSGPALRTADGKELIKSSIEGKGGCFPPNIAEAGVLMRVQDAEASWASDKVTILNYIVQSDAASMRASMRSRTEPPREHARYDEMNRAVRGLFRGAALFSHTMNGDFERVRELLSDGTKGINYQDPDGFTPAFMSAANDHTKILQFLVDCQADLNLSTNNGRTPAYVSAYQGHTKSLQLLAHCKADLNVATSWGDTPALTSARNNNVEILKLLADCKADLNQANTDGCTPVFKSAENGNVESLQLLAQCKADVNKADNDGYSPASVSAQNGHQQSLQFLVKCKADLNQADKDGTTPAYVSAMNGHAKSLLLLAQCKADLNKGTNNGRTPAFVSAQQGHTQCLQLLAQCKADLNKADNSGYTPASVSVQNGHVDTFQMLVDAGADVNTAMIVAPFHSPLTVAALVARAAASKR